MITATAKNKTDVNFFYHPSDKISHYLTTKDYSKFKFIKGNRDINKTHLEKLKASIAKKYLHTVITVNERFEIIDGQHRYCAIKDLGLPLNYIVCDGYELDEVHVLNTNNEKWNWKDYLNGYCNSGLKDYLLFMEFKEKYNFPFIENLIILYGSYNGDLYREFKIGKFKIRDYNQSCIMADKITKIGKFYPGFKRRSFILAMTKLLKNKNFDYDQFIQKLKNQQTALVDCINAEKYIELIEEIYNFKSRIKVNLRF